MPYSAVGYLETPVGNRALAPSDWQGKLIIPSLVSGSFEDVREGCEIVFVAEDDGRLIEAMGLEHFVATNWNGIPVVIFDNHNHALYFWYEARARGLIQNGATLVHIDEHSDLWENENNLEKPDSHDLEKVYEFTNHLCNVGNYIKPAMREWLVGEMIRIEGEVDLLRERGRTIQKNSILNLDLDFFSPDLDDVPFDLKKEVILHFARQVSFITIASSPFFIEQKRAIEYMMRIFAA